VGDQHFVPVLAELFTDPDRVSTCFEGDASRCDGTKVFPQRRFCCVKAALFGDFALWIENAIVASLVSQINANRQGIQWVRFLRRALLLVQDKFFICSVLLPEPSHPISRSQLAERVGLDL
jgi:hypothetical protein